MTAKTTATAGKKTKKPAVARKSSKAAKTTSSKMTAAQKHTAHVKHEQHLAHVAHLTAIGKAPKVALARAGEHLPVCAFEAIAQSLRLAGQLVHDDDVAGLWDLAGADPDGASVGDALAAAALFGLAGMRPAGHPLVVEPGVHQQPPVEGLWSSALAHGCAPVQRPAEQYGRHPERHAGGDGNDKGGRIVHGLILQVDVPGPHAVLATADGWWSWGELHDPWRCRVEEAWAVSWS